MGEFPPFSTIACFSNFMSFGVWRLGLRLWRDIPDEMLGHVRDSKKNGGTGGVCFNQKPVTSTSGVFRKRVFLTRFHDLVWIDVIGYDTILPRLRDWLYHCLKVHVMVAVKDPRPKMKATRMPEGAENHCSSLVFVIILLQTRDRNLNWAGKIIATSAEVALNGGFVRESPPKSC